MSRRSNELFIGAENMMLEGRNIKHPAKISYYANVKSSKLNDDPVEVCGIDLETDYITGELKLLGFYKNRRSFAWYTRDFINVLYNYVKWASKNQTQLAYWNRLDPAVIFKQFLLMLPEKEARERLGRFGKVSGEWSNKEKEWEVNPVVEITMKDGCKFGIRNAIRSSIQFYWMDGKKYDEPQTVWAYDIAQLFPNNLEKECLGDKDEETGTYPNARFPWYTKMSDEFHKVDWERFKSDRAYQLGVLRSNELDARACTELAYTIQEDFREAFGYYPKTLISQGSLARAAIVAQLTNILEPKHSNEKELKSAVHKEVASIGFMNYYDEWAEKIGHDQLKDLYCLATEAYSGGYIDAIRYGYAKEGYYADIASAYPAVITKLTDLRGSKIYKGTGKPPSVKNGYVFIRGTVTIPHHVQYHPITVKHATSIETNVRPVGTFRASYIIEERDFVESVGGSFEDEEWYAIETSAEPSPLATVCHEFIELRKKLKKKKSSSEHMAKIAANSLYGILYEAVDTHQETTLEKEVITDSHKDTFYRDVFKPYKKGIKFDGYESDLKSLFDNDYNKTRSLWHNINGTEPDVVKMELESAGVQLQSEHPADIIAEIDSLYRMPTKHEQSELEVVAGVRKVGYRAGEFWNPLYATVITAKTRILMAEAATAIEKNGGKPIILMTDSITWQGTGDMLPSKFVRKQKTLGYFEEPEHVKEIVCLGSGRYGFMQWNAKDKAYTEYIAKRRGLNATDIHDPNGEPVGGFSWKTALNVMEKENSQNIKVSVRTLITPGMVEHQHLNWRIEDMGRIVDENREVDAIVGLHKRMVNADIKDPKWLACELIDTSSIIFMTSMFGDGCKIDQTFPKLREALMQKELLTRKEKNKRSNKKSQRKYYKARQKVIRDDSNKKYNYVKSFGFSPQEAKLMAYWSDARLQGFLADKGLI